MKQSQTQVSIGFLINEDGHILLGLRAPWKKVLPNVWDGIGGRLELGENADDALVREVREEVGVVPINYTHVKSVEIFSKETSSTYQLNMFVVREWTGGDPHSTSDEHSEIGWFPVEEIPLLPNVAFQEQLEDLIVALIEPD